MKKLLLCFLLVFPFIVSCDKDDENNLEKEFFTVKNGSYKNGNLPSGDDSFISNMQMNNNVINGGTSLITFTSSEQLNDLYVGVKGLSGYYECPLNSVKTTSVQGDYYEYEVILLLYQELSEEKFFISLSAVSKSGKRNKILHSDEIDVVTVATGKLQISLSWDQMDDVDLYLLEPDNNVICYFNRFSSDQDGEIFYFYCYLVDKYTNHSSTGFDIKNNDDVETLDEYIKDIPKSVDIKNEIKKYADERKDRIYGFLDLDSNAACSIDGVNNENITYSSNVKDGIYTVAVNLYSKCNTSKPGARYAVTVNYDGQPITIASKQSGQFTNNYYGNLGDISENLVIIGAFKISGGKIEAVSTENRNLNVRSFKLDSQINNKILKTTKKSN